VLKRLMKWSISCVMSLLSAFTLADDVRVAVASNFLTPMTQLAQSFEQQTGHRVRISSGSSGRFYAQIQHGAPFDVFLSADADKPRRLVNEGLALSRYYGTYVKGVLVLLAAKQADGLTPLQRLQQGRFSRLSLANPKLAPYGLAAEQALTAMNLASSTRSKWIQGENISQAFQFVFSGNANLGFVAGSQVMQASTFDVWVVPSDHYAPILQDMVVLTGAADNAAALALFRYVMSDAAQTQIRALGYQ